MRIEQQIRELLLTYGAVTAIVGEGSAARIRPDDLAEGDALPAIIIQVENEDHEHTLDATAGFANTTVKVICRAVQRQKSRDLADAVKTNGTDPSTGLDNFSCASFDGFCDSTSTHTTDAEDGSDDYWYDTDLSITLLYGV